MKGAAYEAYVLTFSGQFLEGITKETYREGRLKNHPYLGIAGEYVHYMSGITDTLYRIAVENIITYDEKRDPETYVFDKLNDGLFKVKSIYFDDLDIELEDYLFEVSEHYICKIFSAMELQERIKSESSPYHDWYNEITDEDNPILLLGKY